MPIIAVKKLVVFRLSFNCQHGRSQYFPAARLRTVSELYPEIVDVAPGEDPLSSCSAIEALDRQEPFINQTLASSALAMLARLFRYGKLNHHGAFFNAETGRMSALPIDPQMWTNVRRSNRRLRVAA
jgi:hypothetical protein